MRERFPFLSVNSHPPTCHVQVLCVSAMSENVCLMLTVIVISSWLAQTPEVSIKPCTLFASRLKGRRSGSGIVW
jgi:hypothetical protein